MFQPKIGRKIRNISLGRKNNVLIQNIKSVNDLIQDQENIGKILISFSDCFVLFCTHKDLGSIIIISVSSSKIMRFTGKKFSLLSSYCTAKYFPVQISYNNPNLGDCYHFKYGSALSLQT